MSWGKGLGISWRRAERSGVRWVIPVGGGDGSDIIGFLG